MLNERKITWCENWLKATFKKYASIELNHLFERANKAGLYDLGTYGSEFSEALNNVGAKFTARCDEDGNFKYHTVSI